MIMKRKYQFLDEVILYGHIGQHQKEGQIIMKISSISRELLEIVAIIWQNKNMAIPSKCSINLKCSNYFRNGSIL